jgi:hypothetical protein
MEKAELFVWDVFRLADEKGQVFLTGKQLTVPLCPGIVHGIQE